MADAFLLYVMIQAYSGHLIKDPMLPGWVAYPIMLARTKHFSLIFMD